MVFLPWSPGEPAASATQIDSPWEATATRIVAGMCAGALCHPTAGVSANPVYGKATVGTTSLHRVSVTRPCKSGRSP